MYLGRAPEAYNMVINVTRGTRQKCCESCACMMLENKSTASPTKPKKLEAESARFSFKCLFTYLHRSWRVRSEVYLHKQ